MRIPFRGSLRIRHRAVALTVAQGVHAILPADPKRVRVLMYNASAVGTGSTVYVGNNIDANGDALAAANGWPLHEDSNYDSGDIHQKLLANVLELFTQQAVYGLAVGATAEVRMIEELN